MHLHVKDCGMLLETHFHAGTINIKRGERILLLFGHHAAVSEKKICPILAKREALHKNKVYTGRFYLKSDGIVEIKAGGRRSNVKRLSRKLVFGLVRRFGPTGRLQMKKKKHILKGKLLRCGITRRLLRRICRKK